MGYKGKGPIRIPGKLYDGDGETGSSGQVLSSTATGTRWVAAASGGSSTFLNLSDTPSTFTASKFLAVNSAGDAVEFVDSPGGGGSTGMDITLGTPTDSSLTDNSALATFSSTTKVTDAIDELNEILGKLAPEKPPNLSTKTLSLPTSSRYSATESSTGTVRTNLVTDDTTPATNTVEEFWDGESGTLSVEVDGSESGSKALTSSDDTGTFTSLIISDDFGYPVSGNGADFWRALDAKIQHNTALSTGSHTFQMKHTGTGDTALFTFYVDNPATPTITNSSFNVTGATSSYVSGVPSIDSGETINVSFTINNAIKTFYNTSKVAEVTGTSILASSRNHVITGTQTPDATIVVTNAPSAGSFTVGTNKYAESNTLTIKGFNSKNSAGTSASLALTNVRVDTKSDESSRIFAGSGTYPTTFGTTLGNWDSTSNLITDGDYDEELQLVQGRYKRLDATDYSNNVPQAGPDYSNDTQTGYRYVLFNTGTITNQTSVTINLQGANGITQKNQTGIELTLRVVGTTATNGWIDCNTPYSAGNPTDDGDAALDFGGSASATSRRITFGNAVKTGTVYVRFGLPSGSTKYITGITKS